MFQICGQLTCHTFVKTNKKDSPFFYLSSFLAQKIWEFFFGSQMLVVRKKEKKRVRKK